MAAGTSALLVGEPGIGKTALAARLRERLVGAARPIGAVTGQALPGRIPFEAFAALLSADAVTNSERTPSGVAREVAATLGSGPGGRGVLFVDDVQSLDPDSVLVLHHLVVDDLATLVMTSLTPAQLPIVLHRLVRGGSCRLIEIFGLDDDDLASALEGALGAPVDPRTERVFLRRASGNPLLMRELLAAAQDAQSLAVVDGVWRLVAQPPSHAPCGTSSAPASRSCRRTSWSLSKPSRRPSRCRSASPSSWSAGRASRPWSRLVWSPCGTSRAAPRSRRPTRSSATQSGRTCLSCGCVGSGWRGPGHWSQCPGRPRTTSCEPQCGVWTPGNAGTPSGCWALPAPRAASVWRHPRGWPRQP